MKARNRNLRALALAAALLSPTAWAQEGEQGLPDMPRVPPAQADPVPDAPEPTLREMQQPISETLNQADTPPPPAPPQAQGAEHAQSHSAVVQRDLWMRLDTDGDGRISASEGEADATFGSNFSAMDADGDGYVSDHEYRSTAPAAMKSDSGAARASARGSASEGDLMRLDANADGAISRSESEADATVKADFAAIDANSDGVVTRAEYRAWLKATRR